MKKIKVAVIGVGFWGRNQVRVFNEFEDVELVAVCDIKSERAQKIAQKYGIKAYTNTEKLLKECDLDAVTVCTWSKSLAAEAIKVVESGKHVLVEKPMARDVEEAEKLVKMAKENNVILMVGFIERFNPGVEFVKQLIDDGELGEVVSLTARRVSKWPERIGDIGVLKDLAIHDIDITRYLLKEMPITVYAEIGRLKHKRLEDYAHIMMRFKKGKSAFIEANWLTPYKVRSLRITGSEAIATLDYITQEVVIDMENKTVKPRKKWMEPLKIELKHFIECVKEEKTPKVTGYDGIKALKIAEKAIESSQNGKAERINP